MSKIKVNWNFGAVRQVEQAVATALEQTAQAVLEDVEKEQVMPRVQLPDIKEQKRRRQVVSAMDRRRQERVCRKSIC